MASTPTFLFTDIEGSTRLVREAGEGYAALLETHRGLLRDAFVAYGGREVGTQGDSFFVVFPTARQAVAAAAAGQRALAAQPWPPGRELRVRMGLHTGEATIVAGDFVGLEVHRAARIGAAGHGGQVLVSEVTALLVRDGLGPGCTLRDLGRHRLKDFTQPEPIYQLDVEGLPSEFPPLNALTAPGDLPVTMGELIGRDREADDVEQLLRLGQRLVTLTGPGGIGKTRLALEVARRLEPSYGGGVLFVPLAGLTDPGLVLVTIADRLGVRGEPGLATIDALVATLGRHPMLLVLDNVEQVVGAGPDLADLLDRTPTTAGLVTSRQVLRVRGEREYRVPPLPPADAVRLFEARARAVQPSFTVTADVRDTVSAITQRLDGLPLAIELAAARSRVFAPDALLARLSGGVDVLGRGAVDLPERQRTLRSTMEWSHELLDRHEQALFARLAVFAGGWTVEAAEVVCSRPGEPDVVDTLIGLLEKSLLVAPDCTACEHRLHMLETVRAYAGEKLAQRPERDEVERRHLDWVGSLAAHLPGVRGPDHQLWIERYDLERANLRAAARRALDRGEVALLARLVRDTLGYLSQRDAEVEAIAWLDEALAAGPVEPAVRGRLLVTRALAASVFADFEQAGAWADEARPLLPPGDEDHAFDRALLAMTDAYVVAATRSAEEAAAVVDEAAAHLAAVGADLGQAHMEATRGSLALELGRLDEAEHHYTTAIGIARRMGNDAIAGRALSLLGMTRLAQGDVAGARRLVIDGAHANRRDGQRTSMAYSLDGLAAVALSDGRAEPAARALAAAAAAREQLGHPAARGFRAVLRDLVDRARAELGDAAYEVTVAEGRRLDVVDALDAMVEIVQPRLAEAAASLSPPAADG